jgi:hypothetical protein
MPQFRVRDAMECHRIGQRNGKYWLLEEHTTIIVLGDVSGKGLKAAMPVSLIVGAAACWLSSPRASYFA